MTLAVAVAILLIAAVLTGLYAVWLRVAPYGPCWWCGGTGRGWLSTPKAYGLCWACKGSGRRPRRGARLVARMTGRELR